MLRSWLRRIGQVLLQGLMALGYAGAWTMPSTYLVDQPTDPDLS